MSFIQANCKHGYQYIYFEAYQCRYCGKWSKTGW